MSIEVRVEPGGHVLVVEPGESVLAAAQRSGWRWPTVCEGEATCGVCFVDVLEGGDGLASPDDDEVSGLAGVPPWGRRDCTQLRLACQIRPDHPLVVSKKGAAPA